MHQSSLTLKGKILQVFWCIEESLQILSSFHFSETSIPGCIPVTPNLQICLLFFSLRATVSKPATWLLSPQPSTLFLSFLLTLFCHTYTWNLLPSVPTCSHMPLPLFPTVSVVLALNQIKFKKVQLLRFIAYESINWTVYYCFFSFICILVSKSSTFLTSAFCNFTGPFHSKPPPIPCSN